MSAGTHIFSVEKGEDFDTQVGYASKVGSVETPINLTGYTAAMDIRKFTNSPTAVISLTTVNLGIVITPGDEYPISLHIDSADLDNLEPFAYVYDLVLTAPGGAKDKIIKGQFVLAPAVTV